MPNTPDAEKKAKQDKKVDDAMDKSFPASDPPATGASTSTEPAAKPVDRQPPVISKEEIESARQGKGHAQNDRFKRTG